MTTISPLPDAPAPSDNKSTFSAKAFAWVAALANFVTQTNAVAGEVNTAASAASTAATAAADASTTAQAAATSAAAASGATKWVSGTTYAEGVVVWSPSNQLSYRRKVAGAGTTDPSADPTNWTKLVDTSINTNPATLAQVQAAALCF